MTEALEQFRSDVGLAIAYVNKIVVEADGYPIEHSASDMRTLLANAFIAGMREAAVARLRAVVASPEENSWVVEGFSIGIPSGYHYRITRTDDPLSFGQSPDPPGASCAAEAPK